MLLVIGIIVAFVAFMNANSKKEQAEAVLENKEKSRKSYEYHINRMREESEREVASCLNYGNGHRALDSLDIRNFWDFEWDYRTKMNQFNNVLKAYEQCIKDNDFYNAIMTTHFLYSNRFFRDFGAPEPFNSVVFEYHDGYIDDNGNTYNKEEYKQYENICDTRVKTLANILLNGVNNGKYSFDDEGNLFKALKFLYTNSNPIFDYIKYNAIIFNFFKKQSEKFIDIDENIKSIDDLYVELYFQIN